nr:MAG TPA: hypothetical protein [Caudoviricetes sp.]
MLRSWGISLSLNPFALTVPSLYHIFTTLA